MDRQPVIRHAEREPLLEEADVRADSPREMIRGDTGGREAAEHLRVLVAGEREDGLAAVASRVSSLGHEAVARALAPDDVASLLNDVEPDVTLVVVEGEAGPALDLIDRVVKEGICPVIAILQGADDDFVRQAAIVGVFAYIVSDDPHTWQNMMEIVLRRFLEYRSLEGAFGRRAVIERAKGVLMERHGIAEPAAFALLREEARSSNRRVVEVADSILGGHRLLPRKA